MPFSLELKPWQKRLAYGLFTAAAFLFALRQTFPAEAVKERLVMEAAAQGWLVQIADVRPAGLAGVAMTGLSLESRDGLRIPVERLDATLRPLPLLLGRRGLGFDAQLFEGRARGFFEEGRGGRHLVAKLEGLDLSRAVPLRKATGLDLAGVVRGDVDLALDDREPAKSTGQLDLAIDGAAVKGGAVPVPGMGGALTVPPIALGQVTARAVARAGRLTFERLEARSPDLELSGEGLYCVLQPRLAFAPIFGKLRLKLSDAFWARPASAGLKGVADLALAQAKGRDGAYGFQLMGTLAQPQARLAP